MNFLVVIADQLSPASLPPYGNRVVLAPHINRLAESGVVFEHAYCSSPLCAPSRASFMSGLLPSRIGVYDNGAEFAASIPTLAHRLRTLGYRTCLAGKMHFIGPDQLHGFETRLTPDIYPAGLHWIPDWTRPVGDPLPWYHDMSSVFEAGVAEATLQIDYDDEVAFRSVRAIYDLARADDGRPFLLVASFSQPHDPWEVRAEHWLRYEGVEIDAPAVGYIADDRLDPHSRRVREMCGGLGLDVAENVVQNARRAHYASISYVDDRVGELLEALGAVGLSDDTVVIFMADHGESLGERGLWYKMTFFEPSVTVPFIVSARPHFAPARVGSNVSLLDLGPTLVDLAGGTADASLDGRSLVPQLGGRAREQAVVSEYLAEGAIAPAVMVRLGPHKVIVSAPDPDQLYDLDADPHELTNLAPKNPALKEEVAGRWDLARLNEAVLESQRRRRVVAEALAVGEQPDWDYQADGAVGGGYVRGSDFWTPFKRARLRRGAATAPPGSRPSSTSSTDDAARR